jgi:hypothetical protein
LNQLFNLYTQFNYTRFQDPKLVEKLSVAQKAKMDSILGKIEKIITLLIEDENVDLTMSLMRSGVYECILLVIESKQAEF